MIEMLNLAALRAVFRIGTVVLGISCSLHGKPLRVFLSFGTHRWELAYKAFQILCSEALVIVCDTTGWS